MSWVDSAEGYFDFGGEPEFTVPDLVNKVDEDTLNVFKHCSSVHGTRHIFITPHEDTHGEWSVWSSGEYFEGMNDSVSFTIIFF